MEVMVQGDQRDKVVEFMIAKGVPKDWIQTHGIKAAKKKK